MEIQDRVKYFLEQGKTQSEAISLAYDAHYNELPKAQQGLKTQTMKRFFRERPREEVEIFPKTATSPAFDFGWQPPKKKIEITDNREINVTTGNPINPNVDLTTGKYNQDTIRKIVVAANKIGIDPYTALSIGLQETKLGTTDENIGHTIGKQDVNTKDIKSSEEYFVNVLKSKMDYANKLGIKDEDTILQTYNGLGKVYPETEQNYHGFKMKKVYGVDVPKEGIDMRKTPLYGKRIVDLRDNVLKQNPELVNYVDSVIGKENPFSGKREAETYGIPKFQQAGEFKKKPFQLRPETNLVQKDNTPSTKRDLSLMLAEYNNIKKDEQELRTTGQIKNPNSIQYRRNIKTQPDIKQDNISTEQRNAPLNPLERPLIYLANPSKILGDIGVPGMETSELDRQAINANRFNPYQSGTDRFLNNAKIGLGYVPEATVNTALAATFMPEGSGALGLVNETLNPLAGTGDLINNLGNKYLPNAYKLNPNAFKANSEMGYRMLGKEGFNDAVETGVLRAKPVPNQSIEGISLARNTNRNPNTGKMQGALDIPYFADSFIDERYAADYMVAVNKTDNNLVPIPTHKGIAPAQAGSIPLENATMYKKDWLQGYKQVEVPKEELIDLYRIQQKGAETFAERAKNGNLHRFFNNPETLARKAEEEKYFGRWFTTDKNDLDWYLKDREFTNPEYIHTQVPKSKLSQYNIENFDKTLSRAPEREFILPQELIDRGKRYTDISQFQQGGHIPIAGASYLATQENKQQGGNYTQNEIDFLNEFAQLK